MNVSENTLNHAQDNLIEVKNLSFSRGKKVIYNDVNLTIRRGKITAIMGPSGTGKTTLLRLIGGELNPDAGHILYNNTDIHCLNRKQLFDLREKMGMLFQSGALFSDLNVYENVAFPIRAHTNLKEPLIAELVQLKLEAVGMANTEALMPNELSGGMKRRVALARAIALDPELIMYDEPFAGQDPMVMAVLVKLIRTLSTALGLTTIIVSHDVEETLSIADYIYIIADGKVQGEGTPQQIANHTNAFVQQFVHGKEMSLSEHFGQSQYLQDILQSNRSTV